MTSSSGSVHVTGVASVHDHALFVVGDFVDDSVVAASGRTQPFQLPQHRLTRAVWVPSPE